MPKETDVVRRSVHGRVWERVACGEITSQDLDPTGRVVGSRTLPPPVHVPVPLLPYQRQEIPAPLPPPRRPFDTVDVNVLTREVNLLEKQNAQLTHKNRVQEKLIQALCSQYATKAKPP